MGLFNHIHNIFDDNKHLEENSIYQLIILDLHQLLAQ